MLNFILLHEYPHRDVCTIVITCVTDDTDGENAAAGLPSHDVDELKQRLIDVWHGFEQSVESMKF